MKMDRYVVIYFSSPSSREEFEKNLREGPERALPVVEELGICLEESMQIAVVDSGDKWCELVVCYNPNHQH